MINGFRISFFIAAIATFVLASCADYDGSFAETYAEKAKAEFDFSTVKDVKVSLDYGELAQHCFLDFYIENPMAEATGPAFVPDNSKTVYSIATDEHGRFDGTISVPAYAERLYVYSSMPMAPQLTTASIQDGKADIVQKMQYVADKAGTRAAVEPEYQVRMLNTDEYSGTNKNVYTIVGSWDPYGKVEDVNNLITEGKFTSKQIASVLYKLWGGQTYKKSWSGTPDTELGNGVYAVDDVNMTVTETYEEGGATYNVESAEIWVDFLTEQAWNENTFGYYYYNKDKPPASAGEISKRFIIIPNASVAAHVPFGYSSSNKGFWFENDNAPMYTNKKIQLLYEESDGKFTKHFPPNVVVGFFLIVNGYHKEPQSPKVTVDGIDYSVRTDAEKKINIGWNTYYSNKDLNSDKKSRFIALKMSDGSYVYGSEDGSDKTYDDFLFSITATPQKAVQTVDEEHIQTVPDLPVEEKQNKDTSYKNTYCFEDMWPDGGDYDINDVVVYHTREYIYNQYNFVNKVTDTFMFKNVENTNFIDQFAVQIPLSQRGTMTLPAGVIDEKETHSIIFPASMCNPKTSEGKTVTITRDLNGVAKTIIDAETKSLNPYIINASKGSIAGKRIEIHMPNMHSTTKGLSATDVISAEEDPNGVFQMSSPWYTSKDGKFPYALTIPGDWMPKTGDKEKITDRYPDFGSWVESNGVDNKEWYRSPKQ